MTTPLEWPPGDAEAIAALATVRPERIPTGLVLRSCGYVERVVDPARWLRSLRRDAAAGPGNCRARTGALQEDIALALAAAGGCR